MLTGFQENLKQRGSITKSSHRATFIVITFLLLAASLYRRFENTSNIGSGLLFFLSSSYIIDISGE